MSDAQIYAGATLIGTVAGMRSLTAPAIVSRAARAAGIDVEKAAKDIPGGSVLPRVMSILAFGELVADKLPFIPSRTTKFPLIARALSGAVSGAALCSSKHRSRWLGALFGAAGAVAGTYAAYELRRRIVKNLHVPDALVAVAEDALAIGSGTLVASKLRSLTAAA
ncbi:MAG: hypothetical protein JWP08_3654 [Bryobacterales bacterium]|nr:hypothetical protein [Bryobacterales bacterium]